MRSAFSLALAVLAIGCKDRLPAPPPAPVVSSADGGADPVTQEIRYLALGDSISQGGGAPNPEAVSFPGKLSERWRAKGCKVTLENLGVSHYTAADVIKDEVPQIETFKPTLITFQVGSNDVATNVPPDTFRAQVKTILAAAKKSGARVIVLGQNEWFRSPDGPGYGGTLEKRDRYDAILFDEAKASGAEVVDLRLLYRQQADKKQWAEDGIHPTPAAYDEMATELARVIPAPCGKP
ncbi:MAG: SGNH/GDSL hydrolase family protein [Labilithrix sp.]|nr:SGNH/GDSL hydrolase family protein [Labilithrix sp.]MCW5817910.1 SGNH/GDSL hydrolase family protein [Labilithrix sp.]